MQGTVKWFSSEKGYGFITPESGEDHYFNVRSINGASLPSNGDTVTFDPKPGKKGPRASNVIITVKATAQSTGRWDDRILCPNCEKKIVPRIIVYQGTPERSVCPYCAETVKDFRPPSSSFSIPPVVYYVLGSVVVVCARLDSSDGIIPGIIIGLLIYLLLLFCKYLFKGLHQLLSRRTSKPSQL